MSLMIFDKIIIHVATLDEYLCIHNHMDQTHVLTFKKFNDI